ncbi:MAG: preprotein translocase subunit YajC [Persephonella sp.]|nr:MAG: preprotein translocase subunit YajC [Persephonella sp.]
MQGGGDPMVSFISTIGWMILLFAIFYFLVIRPQQKQRKKHEEFLKNLKKGQVVVTTGGIIGEIKGISENIVNLKIADGTIIKVLKVAISAEYEEGKKGEKE